MQRQKIILTILIFSIVFALIYLLYINLTIDIQKNRYKDLIENDKPIVEINLKNSIDI